MSNEVGGKWIQYCAGYASTQTVSYTATGSYPGSQWYGESSVATSTRGQASFSAVPGMQVRPSSVTSATLLATTTESSTTTAAGLSATTNSDLRTPCSAGGCVVTSTSLISLLPAASNDVTLNINAQNSSSNRTSPGLIAGVVVGAAAVCALIAAALWFTRRRWLPCCGDRRHKSSDPGSASEKLSTSNNTPPSTGHTGEEKSAPAFLSPDHISQPVELEGRSGSVSAPWPVDTITVRGLGIAGVNQKRYAPTNPDPTSATDGDAEQSPIDTSPPVVGQSESAERPLPASPAISGSASPPSSPPPDQVNTPSAVSPLTPAYKHTSTAPYTPSAYAYEPPSSVPRTVAVAPPSLTQEYSLVSLGSSSNIYRGLSQRGGAPWAYLSPEDAVRGGWRNGEDA
ncbi:hypothetical protein LTS10_004982 [Elasticomyces elasticus]|nr:hypothetical protein LTS10_004982 [Elasticomyces elasticus]